MDAFLLALAFSVGVNLIMFVPAFIYKTDKLTDITYALTFLLVAVFSYWPSEHRPLHTLLLVIIALWSTRIGGFLLMRVLINGWDNRFDGMRENFVKFLRFWILQGVTVAVVLLAAILAWRVPETNITLLSIVGVIVFIKGLSIEAIADQQKIRFKQSGNKGWKDTGIWRTSSHPNYLGEMLVWSGVYLTAASSLSGNSRLIAPLSPLYIICLLLFATGIPILEKAADKRWGSDKAYQNYKKTVPLLIPTPRSIARLWH